MIPNKIYTDCDEINQPAGYARRILNSVDSKTTKRPSNEKGFSVFSESYTGFTMVGSANLKNEREVLFSIKDSTGIPEIGILNKDGSYETRISDASLSFDVNYPVTAEIDYNFKGEIIVAFVADNIKPKLINLDDIKLPFNINDIQLFATLKDVKFSYNVSDSGGSLLTGVHYLVFKYKDKNKSETGWTSVQEAIYINEDSVSEGFNNYDGSKSGISTSKSVDVTLANVDTNYNSIIVGVIYKKEGEISVKEVKEVFIGGDTVQFTYEGSETSNVLSLVSVLTPPIYYNRIKHLTQSEGLLYGAGTSEELPIGFQKYALRIKLKWKSELIDALDINQSQKNVNIASHKRGFFHGEVYAFYISLKLKNAGWTKGFIIAGRKAETISGSIKEDTANSTAISTFSYLSKDISIGSDSKYFHFRDTTRNINSSTKTGDFGFYENQDEFYPNTDDFNGTVDYNGNVIAGGEDLRGQKVRHFKFPSIEVCKNSLYSSETKYGIQKLDILSVLIDSITIPQELQDVVEGYKLFYAKRSPNNSTIAAQDITLFGAYSLIDGENSARATSGGNFRSKEIGDGNNNDDNNHQVTPNKKSLRFHSPDLLIDKPSFGISYIENIMKMKRTGLQQQCLRDGSDEWAYKIDYTDVTSSTFLNNSSADKVVKVQDFRYIPNNTISGNVVNLEAEETAVLEINGNALSIDTDSNGNRLGIDANDNSNELQFEEVYLANLMMYKRNIYSNFYSQPLVATNKYFLISDVPSSTPIYGGDSFIVVNSFITYGYYYFRPQDNVVKPAQKLVRRFISEAVNNINLRYEDVSNIYSKYYPNSKADTDDYFFFEWDRKNNPNQIAYNKDYTSVNDLNAIIPFNPFEEFLEDNPNRIIRCVGGTKDNRVTNWKTFLANDYLDIPKNKGDITNIVGNSDGLFINTEYTIYRTRGKEELQTDEFKTVLGTGDIFQYPPKELIDDRDGYAGCQHKFSCLLTPYGYVFFDENKSELFMVKDSPVPITDGIRNFIESKYSITEDNPFKDSGYTIAWDEEYKRLIFSKIGVYTYSYSFSENAWKSEHTYLPSFMFNTRNNLFSYKLDTKKIYKHNTEGVYGIYYDANTINPFEIVAVFNQEPELIKNFYNFNWLTHVFKTTGELRRDITFTNISLWDRYQATTLISLIPFDSSKGLENNFDDCNIRRNKNVWNFNKIRDEVINYENLFVEDYTIVSNNIDIDKEFYLKKPFVDNFIVVKFLYNNQKIDNLQLEMRVDNLEANYNKL